MQLRYLFTYHADLRVPQEIGSVPFGTRMIFDVTGGHFEGPDFKGTILAVVHDRYFIEGFASEIWEIRMDNQEAGVTPTLKTWQL